MRKRSIIFDKKYLEIRDKSLFHVVGYAERYMRIRTVFPYTEIQAFRCFRSRAGEGNITLPAQILHKRYDFFFVYRKIHVKPQKKQILKDNR